MRTSKVEYNKSQEDRNGDTYGEPYLHLFETLVLVQVFSEVYRANYASNTI
jgi:hypothetical protein